MIEVLDFILLIARDYFVFPTLQIACLLVFLRAWTHDRGLVGPT